MYLHISVSMFFPYLFIYLSWYIIISHTNIFTLPAWYTQKQLAIVKYVVPSQALLLNAILHSQPKYMKRIYVALIFFGLLSLAVCPPPPSPHAPRSVLLSLSRSLTHCSHLQVMFALIVPTYRVSHIILVRWSGDRAKNCGSSCACNPASGTRNPDIRRSDGYPADIRHPDCGFRRRD